MATSRSSVTAFQQQRDALVREMIGTVQSIVSELEQTNHALSAVHAAGKAAEVGRIVRLYEHMAATADNNNPAAAAAPGAGNVD